MHRRRASARDDVRVLDRAAELTLAAEIVGFCLHAFEALGQAMDPNLSLKRVIRLRGSAVSLSREAHESQRKLDQPQRTHARRQTDDTRPPPQPEPARDAPNPAAVYPTEADRPATRAGSKIWLQSYHQRQAAERAGVRQPATTIYAAA